MPLRVHVVTDVESEDIPVLKSFLGDSVLLSYGRDVPDPADHEFVVTGRLTEEIVAASPRLRGVVIPFTGPPPFTWEVLRRHPHLEVYNSHHNDSATAETALMLLMAAAKFTPRHDREFRANGWPSRLWTDRQQVLLDGKSALILGYGAIGRRVARMCRGLDMKVLAVRRSASGMEAGEGGDEVHPVSALAELLPRANVLICCLPGTPETHGMIGAAELAALARPSIVVNVGRGPVIDEQGLYEALRDKVVTAAGLDVWWRYPGGVMDDEASRRPSAFAFEELDNVVMFPHMGGQSHEDQERRMREVANVLNAAANGQEIPNRMEIGRGY